MAEGSPPILVTKIRDLTAAKESLEKPGDIRPFPFRVEDLPPRWYHANGDRYPLDSPQGGALLAFSDGYKADWGLTVVNGTVNLPSMYYPDGRGMFTRPGDGVDRLIGSAQDDGIINITGYVKAYSPVEKQFVDISQGALYRDLYVDNYIFQWSSVTNATLNFIGFDASLDTNVKIADENRPLNVAMTPAVYLGV